MTKYLFKLKLLGKMGGYQFKSIEANNPEEAETILMRQLLENGVADRRVIVAIYEEKWHLNSHKDS